MTHTPWDQVPYVLLHKDTEGELHPDPECMDVIGGIRGTETLADVIVGGHYHKMCNQSTCTNTVGMFTAVEIHHLQGSIRRVQEVLGGTGQNAQTIPYALANARAHTERVSGQIHVQNLKPGVVKDTIEDLLAYVQTKVEEGVKVLKSPPWQEQYHQEMLQYAGDPRATCLKKLQKAGLGEPTDMGMLVAPRHEHWWHPEHFIIEGLVRDTHQPNQMVIAPLGALHDLVDSYDSNPAHLGRRRQVVNLPEDLTPQLEDTILGLYQAGSDGPMGLLPEVVKAARMLLAQKT